MPPRLNSLDVAHSVVAWSRARRRYGRSARSRGDYLRRKGFLLLAVGAFGCLGFALAQQTPSSAQGGRGRGGRQRSGRKVVLAWADTRNGIAQHDSVSHALALMERLGYESGLWDTYIRTDSNIVSYQPQMTTGQPASGGPAFSNADAIFFMGTARCPSTKSKRPTY